MSVRQEAQNVGQTAASKKEEEKRKQILISNVFELKGNVTQHPAIHTLLQKYSNMNLSSYDKDSLKLDLLRSFSLYRLNIK